MIPLLGFMPDADPAAPGVITDCEQLIPYTTGMEAAPTAVTPAGVPALVSACLGATVVTNLAGARRVIAGTATKLYELGSSSWSDVSRATVAYNASADARWSIAQFGDATLCSNKGDTIQRSTGGAFSDISGAPKAAIIFTVGSFVMALNVNDGTEKSDGWHCSAAFDDTDWTESLATQSASGRLVSSPGAMTAGQRLGEYAIAYKSRSIYLGQYVGAPSVWDWVQVPGGDAGCIGKDALCDIGSAHFFVGENNFWVFDGSRPVAVADDQVRDWFFTNSDPQYRYKTICTYDNQTDRVWVFFPGKGSSVCNRALVWHRVSRKWGLADRTVQAALNYVAPGLTFDTLSSEGATYNSLPDISFDSQYWLSGGRALSVFNSSHQLQLLTGAPGASSFTTGDVGDDDAVTLLRSIRLRYASGRGPATATAQTFKKMSSGDDLSDGASGAINDGKFDVIQTGRWHRAKFSFTGDVRVTGMKGDYTTAGRR
jgi:hypothetical protein